MKKSITKALAEALHAPRTTRVLDQTDKWPTKGYVVGLSEKFVMLHQIDTHVMCLNGYVALPLREISAILPDDYNDFDHRALQLKGLEPVDQPDILLLDFPGLLSSADAHFPLVTIETGHLYPDECYIGRVAKLTKKSVTLREINPAAQWNRVEKYRFKDITSIDFGDGYAESLYRVAKHEKESQKKL